PSAPLFPYTTLFRSSVLEKRSVRLADLYAPEGIEASGRRFKHDRSFDTRFGYQTRSMITTPMISPGGEVLAVIQLINARTDRARSEEHTSELQSREN